ncbi:MAG TPA: AI-2E family transporter [Bacteroidales bacterium]|nr:AI-2E family transporter [Bacteroidales bacterium]
MRMSELSTTNKILAGFAVVLGFYILKELAFIFAPLMLAFILTLLFMPWMRRLLRKGINRILALSIVTASIVILGLGFGYIVRLSGKQIIEGRESFYDKFDSRLGHAIAPYAGMLGIAMESDKPVVRNILESKQVNELIFGNVTQTLGTLQRTLTFLFLTLFFLVLLLTGSVNLERLMGQTIFSTKTRSVKTYIAIEQNVVKFLEVKAFVSLLTGIAFGLISWGMGLSFPLFWGLMAFALNFVQLIGSLFVTALGIMFAFVELDSATAVLLISGLFAASQLLIGSVLEPILMGKSFRINILAVLFMLMFWGYMWGIPGVILSIPITVIIKTLLEQFQSTKGLSRLLS